MDSPSYKKKERDSGRDRVRRLGPPKWPEDYLHRCVARGELTLCCAMYSVPYPEIYNRTLRIILDYSSINAKRLWEKFCVLVLARVAQLSL